MAGKSYDAVIVGAGPAGASTARTLTAGGLKCLLIEKKKLPRHKMCSGILSNWAFDFVHRKFGAIPEGAYGEPNFLDGVSLHFPSFPKPVSVNTLTPIPNVWRSHFDHYLAVKSKTPIRDGFTLQVVETSKKGYQIKCKYSKNGSVKNESIRSKYLVAADGANSRIINQVMPDTINDLPFGVGMQYHFEGTIDLDPKRYHVFLYPGLGFYAWASIKDNDIHVGSGITGTKGQHECLDNFIALLKDKYNFVIKKRSRVEGMAGYVKGPIGVFTLGIDNLLAAGDAGGFIHNFGEGISCALTTGDLAGEAILKAEETGEPAINIYRHIVRNEIELCLDQFNPLRMLKKTPMPMDFKSLRKELSLKDFRAIWKDLKVYNRQDNGFAATGIGKVSKRNMLYHLFHGHYPVG